MIPMQNLKRKPQGYKKLASLMGPYPEVAIFRHFGALTMFNLMRLQAELVAIEDELQWVGGQDDLSPDPDVQAYSKDFHKLNHAQPPNDTQLKLSEKSRIKLEQYHSLLLKASKVARLNKPKKYDLKFLRKWLIGETEGDSFLGGLELLRTWHPDYTQDLVTVASADPAEAPISDWFNPKLVDLYHTIWGGRREHRKKIDDESGNVYDPNDTRFIQSTRIGFSISATIIASLLPALAILWLDHVKRTVVRIWITVGLTTAIGIFLRLCTTANMKEIFGATAAFAAVEVVFIGSANGTGS